MVESLLCEKLSREPVMIPDITYLILNYNPFGDGIAQDVLGATIDSFYARKSKKIAAPTTLILSRLRKKGNHFWENCLSMNVPPICDA